jgi:hypothetical protein
VVAGQEQAPGRLEEANVAGGVAGRPDDLEAVRSDVERLAALQQAIRF